MPDYEEQRDSIANWLNDQNPENLMDAAYNLIDDEGYENRVDMLEDLEMATSNLFQLALDYDSFEHALEGGEMEMDDYPEESDNVEVHSD
jgi:hypothetical protein